MALPITIGGASPSPDNIFDISAFKAGLSNSYHRTSSFRLLLTVPTGLLGVIEQSTSDNADFAKQVSKLSFDVERVNMPGISIATDEIRRYGIGYFQRKPYVPTFETLDIIVRSDGAGANYDFFQAWMKLIINYGKPTSPSVIGSTTVSTGGSVGLGGGGSTEPYEVNYKTDYATIATVTAYNEDGNTAIEVALKDAFPMYLGDMQYDWSETNTIVKFPVRLTFSDWSQSKNFITKNGTGTASGITNSNYATYTPSNGNVPHDTTPNSRTSS